MNLNLRLSCRAFLFCLALASSVVAQNTNSTVTTVQVPRLMRISGTLNLGTDAGGVSAADAATSQHDLHRTSGVVGVTFALYAEETGGAPLWLETQNVQVDNTGHYSVLLGSTQAEGLPIELFTSGQAQWLGVQQQGQTEQPRIMLFSVPYALKAADAETFGGKPPSAYASAQPEQTESPTNPAPTAVPANGSGGSSNSPHPLPITGSGTTNYLPIWTSASNLASSVVYQGSTVDLVQEPRTPRRYSMLRVVTHWSPWRRLLPKRTVPPSMDRTWPRPAMVPACTAQPAVPAASGCLATIALRQEWRPVSSDQAPVPMELAWKASQAIPAAKALRRASPALV